MPKGFGNDTQGCAFAILNFFIALQMVFGLFTIAISEYYKYTIAKHVGRNERDEINMQLFFMELYGFHLIVSYGCGFPISRKFAREPYTTHFLTLLKIWHIFILVVSIDGFLASWMLFRTTESLSNAVEMSLLRGIEVYYTNPEWRIIWDDMQYHEQCCGVHSYKDWQSTAWIEYEYDDNTALYQQEPSDSKMLSLTPYSCCKKDVGCFESYLPQQAPSTFMDLPTLNLSGINQDGCMAMFEHEYAVALYTQLIVAILVFVVQVFILVIMRVIFIQKEVCFPLQKVNSECQTTYVVTCPKRDLPPFVFQDDFVCPDEDEDCCPPKKCSCSDKKRVDFCPGDACSPLLIH